MNATKKFVRVIALAVFAFILLSACFGYAFLSMGHSGDCVKEDCPVCMAINTMRESFGGGLFSAVSLALLNFLSFRLSNFKEIIYDKKCINLVSLKVKLSN